MLKTEVAIEETMERPKGVTAIAVYYIGGATVLMPLVLLLSRRNADEFSESVLLFTSVTLLGLSIGLWRMKNWARVSAAVLTVIGLLAGVVSRLLPRFSYNFGTWYLIQDLIIFSLHLWIAVYLLSSRVKRAFLS
jgi:hypothetical protein